MMTISADALRVAVAAGHACDAPQALAMAVPLALPPTALAAVELPLFAPAEQLG